MGAGKGKQRRVRSQLQREKRVGSAKGSKHAIKNVWHRSVPQCEHIGSVFRTSSRGVPARMELYLDIDDGVNDGWVVDLVELHTDDGPAGYLKISFIPQEKLEEYFPTALEWAVRHKSKHRLLRDLIVKPDDQWSRAEYLQALCSTTGWMPYGQEKEIG